MGSLPAPPMQEDTAFSVGRWFFGIAVAGSGALQLVVGDFVRLAAQEGAPGGQSAWPYLIGVVLFATGCMIATGRLARPAGAVVVGLLLVALVAVQIPRILDNPWAAFMWIKPLKTVALAGGAGLLAAALPIKGRGGAPRAAAVERIERVSVLCLAVFLFVCGLQHFVYADFVAALVPSWIPGQRFWALFAGVALMAGGVGLLASRTARLAAFLSAVMIFSWVLLLHIPRAVAGPDRPGETAGVFEALAISGIALLIAARRDRAGRRSRTT
jgi:uncharacterized membrane protein YphA (DoxX/SURF4 family)